MEADAYFPLSFSFDLEDCIVILHPDQRCVTGVYFKFCLFVGAAAVYKGLLHDALRSPVYVDLQHFLEIRDKTLYEHDDSVEWLYIGEVFVPQGLLLGNRL